MHLRRMQVHALSSGLKALAGIVVSDGVELSRKLCGGHGYLLSSALPDIVTTYTAVNTFEGTTQGKLQTRGHAPTHPTYVPLTCCLMAGCAQCWSPRRPASC